MPTRHTRESDIMSVVTQISTDWNPSGFTNSYETVRQWQDERTTSANHPDWKALIKAGRNCSTELSGWQHRARSVFGTSKVRTTNPNYGTWSEYIADGELSSMMLFPQSFSMPDISLYQKARSQAEISFTKDFRNKTRSWQSGVFAGELLQTVKLLTSPAKALRSGVSKLYDDLFRNTKRAMQGRGNFKPRDVRDAISGTYLEWQFGVKPLIQDLDDAAKAMRSIASGRTFDMIRIRGHGDATSAETATQQFVAAPGFLSNNDYRQEVSVVHGVEVYLNGAWRSDLPSGFLPPTMTIGATLGDILPTAWELVPWSFLLDYFSNIGDVLDTWGMRFIDFAWINQTVRWQNHTVILPPPGIWGFSTGDGTEYEFTTRTKPTHGYRKLVQRYPYDNSWTPRIMGKIPGTESTKWLNLAALASMRRVPSHLSRLG